MHDRAPVGHPTAAIAASCHLRERRRAIIRPKNSGPNKVDISFSLVGRAGENYAGVVEKDGKRPAAPTLKILDEKGKELGSGKFEFG